MPPPSGGSRLSEALRQELQPDIPRDGHRPGAVATELTDHSPTAETKLATQRFVRTSAHHSMDIAEVHRVRRSAAAARMTAQPRSSSAPAHSRADRQRAAVHRLPHLRDRLPPPMG